MGWRQARYVPSTCAIWSVGRRNGANRRCGNWEWTRSTWARSRKFLTVASNLESGEPLWFGRERKKETLDGFFQEELSARQRRGIEAACVDMWEPYRQSIEQWAPRGASYTTSSTLCSTPTAPWTKCGERSFSAKAGGCADW